MFRRKFYLLNRILHLIRDIGRDDNIGKTMQKLYYYLGFVVFLGNNQQISTF
jgi:hypothetical protein